MICMKTKLLLSLLLSLNFCLSYSQIPQGFNYQAIARDGSGNPITGATIKVKLSILSDTTGFYLSGAGTYIWEEEQTNIKTNAFGLFTIIFGNPLATKIQGSASNFSAVQWSATPLFIGTKIANPSTYKNMGSAKLWSVPYSLVSGTLAGSLNKLSVKGNAVSMDSALFEVKNNTGQTVFAVYNEGVRIYVDDGIAKGATKGGFAIGGFETVKAPSQEFFRVTRDSTRVYVNPAAKGATKGGFAIGGFATVKGSDNNYLDITPNNYFIGQGAGKSNTAGLYNSFMGYQNGYSNTKGSQNVFLGYHSGFLNDTASYNVFVGNETGYSNSSGANNTFLGFKTGYLNSTGSSNVFIGNNVGTKITTSNYNTFIGNQSGINATSGDHNVFLGALAGAVNTANFNIFIGNLSGYNNTTGTNNIFAGVLSGASNRKGSSNIYIGLQSGYSDTTGSWNIFLGESAGFKNVGSNNLIFGYQAGYLSSTGSYNLMLGTQSGAHNTGDNNLFQGYQSGYTNTTGSGNVFLGPLSGGYNLSGADNTFIGNQAGYHSSTGSRNIAIGTEAGFNVSSISNIFLGYESGYNTTGMQNIFMGTQAGVTNTSGYNNIFLGVVAGQFNTSGASNVFIGTSTGYKNTTGNYSTSIGNLAGANNQTGSANVFLGNQAGFYETGSNRLYIENSPNDKYNALIYGEFDNKRLTINGSMGIGTTIPSAPLDIAGGNWNVAGAAQGDFRIGSGAYSFNIGLANAGGGAGDVRLTSKGGTNRLILGGGGIDVLLVTSSDVVPWSTNASYLGTSANRWLAVYSANGTIQTSDARLKSNIKDIGYGLETILNLRPVSFTWKDDTQNALHLGLIAQDVQKVIGEVVDTGKDSEKTLGINYTAIVPVLIKGIQEQQSQLELVKQENLRLKSGINSLQAQVKLMESRLEEIESITGGGGK
jgi:trimeric autotransporter adhesin